MIAVSHIYCAVWKNLSQCHSFATHNGTLRRALWDELHINLYLLYEILTFVTLPVRGVAPIYKPSFISSGMLAFIKVLPVREGGFR
jgi:hypothetical protein